jgi:hypothetical protein
VGVAPAEVVEWLVRTWDLVMTTGEVRVAVLLVADPFDEVTVGGMDTLAVDDEREGDSVCVEVIA